MNARTGVYRTGQTRLPKYDYRTSVNPYGYEMGEWYQLNPATGEYGTDPYHTRVLNTAPRQTVIDPAAVGLSWDDMANVYASLGLSETGPDSTRIAIQESGLDPSIVGMFDVDPTPGGMSALTQGDLTEFNRQREIWDAEGLTETGDVLANDAFTALQADNDALAGEVADLTQQLTDMQNAQGDMDMELLLALMASGQLGNDDPQQSLYWGAM